MSSAARQGRLVRLVRADGHSAVHPRRLRQDSDVSGCSQVRSWAWGAVSSRCVRMALLRDSSLRAPEPHPGRFSTRACGCLQQAWHVALMQSFEIRHSMA